MRVSNFNQMFRGKLSSPRSPSLKLEEGARVAVMGGGPAGSLFAYFLLDLASRVRLKLEVDVYEPPEPFGAPKVLPTTIVLDREGRAVKAFLGPVTMKAIEQFIDGDGG